MSTTQQNSIQWTKYGIAVLLIILLGAFLRLYGLDRMAYHHDESIHAFYAHKEYKGDFRIHPYDPTYHGQFLYHFGALFFLIFGDTDAVGRLPQACFGILMLYFVWRLRPYIGNTGVLVSILLIAFSPTLTYFSRFARNDITMGTFAVGILLFSLDYLRTLKSHFLVGAAFLLALMYTCKENSYMTGCTFGSYAVFFGIYYYFSYPREVRHRAMTDLFHERSPFLKLLALYGLFSCTAFSFVYYVSHHANYRSTATLLKTQRNAESYDINILRDTWNNFMQVHPGFASWGVFLWIAIPIAIAILLFLLFDYLGHRYSTKTEETSVFSRIAHQYAGLAVCIFVMFAVYTAMFTNFGYTPQGMKAGVVDYLLYWMGQQGDPRIPGPPDYYIPRLLIYEPVLVLFCVIAFLVYTWNGFGPIYFAAFQVAFWVTIYGYWRIALLKSGSPVPVFLIWLIGICVAVAIVLGRKFASLFSFIPAVLREPEEYKPEEENPLRPDGIRIFFLYWTLFSLLIYAFLEEKVPWLMVHQVVPMALLAGVFIADLWKKLGPGTLRSVLAVLVGLLAVYEARTAFQLNMYRPDDPRELMVYTQTDPRLLDVVREIKEGAVKLGPEYMPPNPTKPIAFFQGTSVWPYVWYFRNYLHSSSDSGMPMSGVPFAVVDLKMEDNMKVWAKGKYTKRRLTHRGWWPSALPHHERITTPSMRHEMPFEYARSRNMKPSDGWRMLWDYLLYRQVWNLQDRSIQPGGEYVLFYSRTPLVEPEEQPAVAQGYDQPVRPLQSIKTAGSFGRGNGEFVEPRGIALSSDESKVYVLDSMNGRIQVFDKELNFIGWFGGPGKEIGHLRVEPPGNGPNGGIGAGPDGTIYVTDTWADGGGRVNRYSPDGNAMAPLTPPANDPFFFPRGLAISRDGVLYVADTGNHRIVKFNSDGSYGGAVVKGQLREPVGVAVGPNGWIYVCDVGMRRIAAFTPQGIFMTQYSILGWNVSNDDQIPWIEPYVSLDANGFVYVSDSTKNVIHRFDPLGQQVAQAGGAGNLPNQLRRPKGVAVDSQGNLYIADSDNHRIVKARMIP